MRASELDEVTVVYIPPVRYNHDTLEFNPNAFKMSPNALVEDLLRKLPGVIVWGDGAITVNGREVKTLLVDGKPFFGGSTKVATQNIPKDAVEKIQIYQQSNDPKNIFDSITLVNIKLKANSKKGYFGKLGLGIGTNNRIDVDGAINWFSPRTQFGVFVAGNNVNKIAANANEMLESTTFKGVGSDFSFQPEFSMPGENKPLEAGFVFQKDFIEKPDNYNLNRLKADYFLKKNNADIRSVTNTITSLPGDSILIVNGSSNVVFQNQRQIFNVRYDKKKNALTQNYVLLLQTNDNTSGVTGSNEAIDENNDLKSESYFENNSQLKNRLMSLSGGLNTITENSNFKSFHLNYSLSYYNGNSNQLDKNTFISYQTGSQNQQINRKYNNENNNYNAGLNFSVDNLINVTIGQFSLVKIGLGNEMILSQIKLNANVSNFNPILTEYISDNYLTRKTDYFDISNKPFLSLKRSFSKGLTNRFNKRLEVEFLAKGQSYFQKNISDKQFQFFSKTYYRFIPEATIRFTNLRIGKRQDVFKVKFDVSAGYPTADQLVPVVDSANFYNIYYGNNLLRPYEKRQVGFELDHNVLGRKYPFNYSLDIRAGSIRDVISDSLWNNSSGQMRHYPVNVNGYRYFNISGKIMKVMAVAGRPFQVKLTHNWEYSLRPSFVNNVFFRPSVYSSTTDFDMYYYLSKYLEFNIGESYLCYSISQSGVTSSDITNRIFKFRLNVNSRVTEKFSLNSNLIYNNNQLSSEESRRFVIWNASAGYRFMKDNSIEMRFSVYDILHQNSNIINYIERNSITTGLTNVLEQYFMFGIKYYPRSFGNGNKNKTTSK
jgi:hypothetical protein